MELNEQEAHCIARLLQSALFGKDIFDGCDYCKFQCYKQGNRLKMFDELRGRLTVETGVDVSPIVDTSFVNAHFPYHKFLVNSNEEFKAGFREKCRWLTSIQ